MRHAIATQPASEKPGHPDTESRWPVAKTQGQHAPEHQVGASTAAVNRLIDIVAVPSAAQHEGVPHPHQVRHRTAST